MPSNKMENSGMFIQQNTPRQSKEQAGNVHDACHKKPDPEEHTQEGSSSIEGPGQAILTYDFYSLIYFWQYQGLNSGLQAC
jgi:hypothetical protein